MPDVADKIAHTLSALFEIGHHEDECATEATRFISATPAQLASYIRAVLASEQADST